MGRKLQHYATVPEARKAVLSAYRERGHVRRACAAAGVSKTWLYEQLGHRPRFKQRWDHALDIYRAREKERQEQAKLQAALAESRRVRAEARAAMKQLAAMYREDWQFEQRWQRAQERKRQRAEQQAQRDAWRAEHPNWRQLEHEARDGWKRLLEINRRIIAEEAERERAMSERTRSRRGFDPFDVYDPDC